MKTAGIDIGSNSVRMIIADIKDNKISQIIASERASTRLAKNIKQTGYICEESFKNSIDVLRKFSEILKKHNVSNFRTVATSAVREASNGQDFIKAAKEIGINVEIISGGEEAMLTLVGVCSAIPDIKDCAVFDVGGGSTEITLYNADKNSITLSESFKIGVVKLVDIFDMRDGAKKTMDEAKKYIKDFFSSLQIPDSYTQIIATAGTATSLAAMDMELSEYDWRKINGYILTKNKIETILDKLLETPFEKRSEITGLEKGREDLIIAGILITLEMMERCNGAEKIVVSDFGLREGVAISCADDFLLKKLLTLS